MKRELNQAEETSQKALELKKHVAVIHSGNKLSLLQRKIANALLYNAYQDLLIKDEHKIHVSALCKLIGYESNDHKTIKNALVNLLSTVLQWNLVDGDRLDDEGIWSASSIIADASIDGSVCTYSYSNKMKKLLYRPNMYGRLDMLVQAKFQSGYGLALYENCNRFQDVGRTPWFEFEKFRLLMGVKEGQYKIFRDFKTRVLNKAVEEVNKYSSIIIEPQYRRQSRQVIAIQFLIKKAEKNVVGLPRLIDDKAEITEVLRENFGLSARQTKDVISNYELNYIYEKISIIENSPSYKSRKIQNLAKYLLSALADDYQPPKATTIAQRQFEQLDSKNPSVVQGQNDFDKQKVLELEAEYQRYQEHELLRLFAEIEEKQKNKLLSEFDKFMQIKARGVYQSIYEREGVKNPLIQSQLAQFLKQANFDTAKRVPDFKQWTQNRKNS